MQADLLIRHARQLLTMDGPDLDPARPAELAPLGLIEDGAVASNAGRIVAVGRTADVERAVALGKNATVFDASDCIVTPGLIDTHTHALYVGDRAAEFGARLAGATYAQIAAEGGGIASSVRTLRAASDAALLDALNARLARMRRLGVTSVEVKTGYGLDTASELRSLRVIGIARKQAESRVFSTFLPLHAVDPSLRGESDGRARFIARCLDETLPVALAETPDFVDAYIDSTGFSVEESRPLLTLARAAGLRVRLHIGQFADVGGAELAAELGALSADHLEHVSDAGLDAMSRAGVVAVVLPGAAFSLGQHWPDARRMRAHGVDVAIATDSNPGTSCTEDLPLMVAFAVRQMGLSIVEGWWGVTRAAARALGRGRTAGSAEIGRIAVGATADLAVLGMGGSGWQGIAYRLGSMATDARAVVVGGRLEAFTR